MNGLINSFLILVLPLASHVQQESTLIGPGDLVTVSLYRTPELDERTRITEDGELQLILGGRVKVGGLTPEEAARVLEDTLVREQYLVDPHIIVTVEEHATQNVKVSGEVRLPGAYPAPSGRSVLDVVESAGGLTDTASRKITIYRWLTHDRISYDIHNNRPEGALEPECTVFAGDEIVVSKAEFVYVLGDVVRPGRFSRAADNLGLTALQAVLLAGGTFPNAVPFHTILIRRHADGTVEESQVFLREIQKGTKADIPLEANDIIYVPFNYGEH